MLKNKIFFYDGSPLRIDVFLTDSLNISRSALKKCIKSIKVDSQNIDKLSHIISNNCKIEIEIEENEERDERETYSAPPLLNIIYECDDFFVIDKECGLCVHHGTDALSNTVEDALYFRLNEKEREELKDDRFGIVHRLDKDTSGLLLIAKNKKSAQYFKNEFKERRVYKQYIAFVTGVPQTTSGIIKTGMRRRKQNRMKYETCALSEGREAITKYRVLEVLPSNISIVEAIIETGRTHQIRVHMLYLGCPVIGDNLYSRNYNKYKDFGLMLHSQCIAFKGMDGKDYNFSSPMPERMNIFKEYVMRDK